MLALVLVVFGAAVSALAFPPVGPGWLILPGVALFLAGLRRAQSRQWGLLCGALYGVGFFTALMWWLSELGLIALIPYVLALGIFFAIYGWWLAGYNRLEAGRWALLAAGGWAVMELIRYHFPFNGIEWGAAGYALADHAWARAVAGWIGVSGWTVLVVTVAALAVAAVEDGPRRSLIGTVVGIALLVGGAQALGTSTGGSDPIRVAIVQGSTPCPFEHCPPNERLRTYQQHLESTMTIEAGSVDLVVWAEGSTGSWNADPVQNPEVGEAIGAEARRIGAWFLVGSDRPISDTHWINANVMFNPEGEIVGEYRKQHPVPFGEYIPFRPLFEWIPDLAQVPRDQIPGDGPVVWETDLGVRLGSVISFEGAFARYPRQHVGEGAEVIVVASNEASYGLTPASDQFIDITRMRAAELGVPVIHSAVTGKSTVIDAEGRFGITTDLGTQEVLHGTFFPGERTLYSRIGDSVMVLAALIGVLGWWRSRTLVGSDDRISEEE